MLRCSNSFAVVCKGPCELLVVGRAALDNPEVESMIWLSIDTLVVLMESPKGMCTLCECIAILFALTNDVM